MSDFSNLGVAESVVRALHELGYEAPTPIQAQSIPILLEGQDLLALAQTGTGKTAAFALPILKQVDVKSTLPQVIVLVPTRELAIQVAESFYHYSKYLPQFKVLAVYGGQAFSPQLRALQRGVQVVVGTPGRIMDHLRRGSLSLEAIRTVILDEADEMLNMGFVDDITWILDRIEQTHQTALFSATMAPSILKIAKRYLKEPQHVEIKAKTHDAVLIQQKFCIVPAGQKLEALALFLELEHNDATLIFTRTKNSSAEVALKLAARGLSAAAINGDMRQEERERVIRQLKNGDLDIVVATEVAARGLDVGRVSLVINYDIPEDPDSYVHRIGRTGRAGREGASLLFVTPRERRMLSLIEKTVKSKMEEVKMPHNAQMQKFRQESFKKQLATILSEQDLETHRALIENLLEEMDCDVKQLAAALAFIVQENQRAGARAASAQKPARMEEETHKSSRTYKLSFDDKPKRDRTGTDARKNKDRGGKVGESRGKAKRHFTEWDEGRDRPKRRFAGSDEEHGRSKRRVAGSDEEHGRSKRRFAGSDEDRGRSKGRFGGSEEEQSRSQRRFGGTDEDRGRPKRRFEEKEEGRAKPKRRFEEGKGRAEADRSRRDSEFDKKRTERSPARRGDKAGESRGRAVGRTKSERVAKGSTKAAEKDGGLAVRKSAKALAATKRSRDTNHSRPTVKPARAAPRSKKNKP